MSETGMSYEALEATFRRARSYVYKLEAQLAELRDLVEDLRCYTHEWDWKYGAEWDERIRVLGPESDTSPGRGERSGRADSASDPVTTGDARQPWESAQGLTKNERIEAQYLAAGDPPPPCWCGRTHE